MKLHNAYLAGGCFWGMEELFRTLPGVLETEAGYSGGRNDNPTYLHHPGHAETVRIAYDPSIMSYADMLDFFFRIHDPTQKNRQGNDIGTSYRSAIFFSTEEERKAAQKMIETVNASGFWDAPVCTSLEPFTAFYPAEPEHQRYLQKNPGGYTCHFVRRSRPYGA